MSISLPVFVNTFSLLILDVSFLKNSFALDIPCLSDNFARDNLSYRLGRPALVWTGLRLFTVIFGYYSIFFHSDTLAQCCKNYNPHPTPHVI